MTDRRRRKARKPPYVVPALERGLLMLQAFSRDEPVRSLGELARELDLPRATVFRLADTLEHLGFLVRDEETGEYRIGAAALKLGWNYLSSLELPQVAYPYLNTLRYFTRASVHMAVRDGKEIVYVSRLPANAALTSNIRVGTRLPAHGSSMGRAMLQDLEDDEIFHLYRGMRELAPFSPETPRTVVELRNLLARDAENDGIVISRGYYEKGVVVVAAPIRDGADRVVAAINVTAPSEQLTDERVETAVLPYVLRTQGNISMALGHDPDSHRKGPGMETTLPHTALADRHYDPVAQAGDEIGHPKYQTREALEKAHREYERDARRLQREEEEHRKELLSRWAKEDEEL